MLRAPVLSPADPETPLDSGEAAGADVPLSRRSAPVPAAPSAASPSVAAPSTPPPAATASVASGRRGITIVLPPADERDRPYLEALAERSLVAAGARIGRPAPARVEIVIHASQESFTRATGEPPWSSGASRATRIDMPPMTRLWDRGILDDAIAHEAAHVVTAAAVAGRATWVREGAALFASGALREAEIARASLERGRTPCPSDQEFQKPASEAAYTLAMLRARACFARALASGLRWDEVR
jgi:hypothetical protein